MVACSVMPEHDIYERYKYKETVDFSDLRDGLIEPEEDETLREIYGSRRESVDVNTPPRDSGEDSPLLRA